MTFSLRHLLHALVLSVSVCASAHPRATAGPPTAGPPLAVPPQATPPVFTPQEVGIDEKLGQPIPLDLTLKDEAGQPVNLRSLIDKPTILSLNYFRCAGICTPQLGGMAEVFDRTQAEPGKDFQAITVSFDPRDTPDMAAQKRANYLQEIKRPFPPSAWRFLTGDAAVTKALADSVGFKFKPQGDDFIHPAALFFLSPKGEITRYMYGVTYLPADLQLAAQEAGRSEARPTISKWLNICFNYDPVGRKYVFDTTRTAAMVIIFGAVVFVLVLVLKGRWSKKKGKEQA
jgi:protein SCO1